MESKENSEQIMSKREGQIPGILERIHSRVRHLGREGEFKKHKRSD